MDLEIRGADNLAALSRRLRAAGEQGKGLRRELMRGIQRSTRPLKDDARANTDRLPQSGGLGDVVKRAKIVTKTRSGGQRVGVRIVAKGVGVMADKGMVRHRVFGGDVWVNQSVPPGWFTDAMEAGAPDVRREIVDAIERVARQIEG